MLSAPAGYIWIWCYPDLETVLKEHAQKGLNSFINYKHYHNYVLSSMQTKYSVWIAVELLPFYLPYGSEFNSSTESNLVHRI